MTTVKLKLFYPKTLFILRKSAKKCLTASYRFEVNYPRVLWALYTCPGERGRRAFFSFSSSEWSNLLIPNFHLEKPNCFNFRLSAGGHPFAWTVLTGLSWRKFNRPSTGALGWENLRERAINPSGPTLKAERFDPKAAEPYLYTIFRTII